MWFGCPSTGEVVVNLGSGNQYKSNDEPDGVYKTQSLVAGTYTGVIFCGGIYAQAEPITIS